MKKNIMNILNIKLLAIVGAVLLISSCSDGIKETSETSSLPSADERTYLCIGGMEISSERSISTSSSNYDAS